MGARSNQGLIQLLQPKQLLWKLTDFSRQVRQRKTLTGDQALGRRGEDLAHRYLRSLGFHILARNYRVQDGSGEIDIIARDRDILVFVEVKSRRSSEYGTPDRAIDAEKQHKIVRAARSYALRTGADWSRIRFDVITIVFTRPASIVHYEDAFYPARTI
jgi:putative endonuclease